MEDVGKIISCAVELGADGKGVTRFVFVLVAFFVGKGRWMVQLTECVDNLVCDVPFGDKSSIWIGGGILLNFGNSVQKTLRIRNVQVTVCRSASMEF